MSDVAQGEGWWQASNGKWYPPELHPDYVAPASAPAASPSAAPEPVPPTQPVRDASGPPTAGPATAGPPPAGPPTAMSPPAGPPTAMSPPLTAPPYAPPPAAPVPPSGTSGSGKGKWIAVAAVAAAVVVIVAVLVLRGGGGSKQNASTTSDARSETSSSSSSSSSKKSSSSSTKSSSSGSSGSGAGVTLDPATVGSKLLKASDIGSSFVDQPFTPDTGPQTNCGQQNVNKAVPPDVDVGSQAVSQAAGQFFQEEVATYKDSATTSKAFDLSVQSVSCTQGTLDNGTALVFDPPRDVSSEFGTKAVDVTAHIGQQGDAELVAVQLDNGVLAIQQQAAPGQLPGNAIGLTKHALARLQS